MKKLFHKYSSSSFGSYAESGEFAESDKPRHFLRRRRITRRHAFGGIFFVGSISLLYAAVGMFFGPIPRENAAINAPSAANMEFVVAPKEVLPPPAVHIKIPDAVKAIYMSACVASTPSIRDRVIHIANTTEVNSIVVDIKDFSGMISYTPTNLRLLQEPDVRSCRIKNIRELIKLLHDNNIYTIGRIAVFQDPYFAELHPELAVKRASDGKIWKDRKGITWLDAGSDEVWGYTASIARDAYLQGFDEINFDYIRFPSDGDMKDIFFPVSGTSTKSEVIKNFFAYLNNEMKTSGITTSADLFGMTTTASDDMNIGQILENALPYFDYISPMVYPSHYPPNFNGWANPNAHPYELIKYVMGSGAEKAYKASTTPLKLRPWLQDFSLGTPAYGKTEVEEQIQATYDSGLTSWMLWDPSNRYAGGALLRE
jgi:hypothetical protein